MSLPNDNPKSKSQANLTFAPSSTSTPRKAKRSVEFDFASQPSSANQSLREDGTQRNTIPRTDRPQTSGQDVSLSASRRNFPQSSCAEQCPGQTMRDSAGFLDSPGFRANYSPKPHESRSLRNTSDVENHPEYKRLINKYNGDMETLLQRQMVEQKKGSFDEKYLDMKHSVELGELQLYYEKEQFKLMQKLMNKLNYTPTDRDVFGSAFDGSALQTSAAMPRYQNDEQRSRFAVAPEKTAKSRSLDKSIVDMQNTLAVMIIRRQRMLSALSDSFEVAKFTCSGRQVRDSRDAQLQRNRTTQVKLMYKSIKLLPIEDVPRTEDFEFAIMASYASHPDDDDLAQAEHASIELMAKMLEYAEHEANSTSQHPMSNDIHEQVEDEVVNTWNAIEEVNRNLCNNSACSKVGTTKLDHERNSIMLKLLEAQSQLRAAVEDQRINIKCPGKGATCTFNDADMEDLDAIQMQMADDVWGTVDILREKTDENESVIDDNANVICQAILAIFMEAKQRIEDELVNRDLPSSCSQAETLNDTLAPIRTEMNNQLAHLIESLVTTDEKNMSCQEKHLKDVQASEKASLIEKYQKEAIAHPCKLDVVEDQLGQELDLLENVHHRQWLELNESKMKFKAKQNYNLHSKSDQMAAGTKSKSNCGCKQTTSKQTTDKEKSGVTVIHTNLDEMEDAEMKHLMQNVRQWQMERRSLLETIEKDINKSKKR